MKKEKEINVKKKEKNDIWGTADRSRQLPAGGKERIQGWLSFQAWGKVAVEMKWGAKDNCEIPNLSFSSTRFKSKIFIRLHCLLNWSLLSILTLFVW